MVVIAGVCALLAVGGTLAVLRLGSRAPANPALARLVAEVTAVPVDAGEPGHLNAVWSGDLSSAAIPTLAFDFAPTPVSGPPLTENWALIVALSRFGSFSGLSTSRSPYFEDVPPVDGWTFYG